MAFQYLKDSITLSTFGRSQHATRMEVTDLELERSFSTDMAVLATVAESCEDAAMHASIMLSGTPGKHHDKNIIRIEGSASVVGGKRAD